MDKETNTSDVQRTEEALKLLRKLDERLHSDNSSIARKAAFRLSWMQEDGLQILEDALFGNTSKRTKSAATYGMRKMRGRMKKKALEVLRTGMKDKNRFTREACERALSLIGEFPREKVSKPEKPGRKRTKGQGGRFKISELPPPGNRKYETRKRPNRRR